MSHHTVIHIKINNMQRENWNNSIQAYMHSLPVKYNNLLYSGFIIK